MNSRTKAALLALSLASSAGLLIAGPLSPPAGSVAPSYKTLSEVEPRTAVSSATTPGNASVVYRITQPGSYYLTGDVSGTNKQGIEITVAGVTLDLNGFTVRGAGGSYRGITSTGRCTIRNGRVESFGDDGIYCMAAGSHYENIVARGNAGSGIEAGTNSRITGCSALDNLEWGIECGSENLVTGCTLSGNGTTTAHAGLSTGDRCLVVNCVSSENAGPGIDVNQDGRVVDCVANANHIGITAYIAGQITGCSVVMNAVDGFNVGDSSTVRTSQARNNGDDGIQVADACTVSQCVCESNGDTASGAGVYIVGAWCRIEDNHFNFNRFGVLAGAASSDSFIVKNTAKNNLGGNFSVSAGNDMAPVISNPGTTFTGVSPWSNFAY